MNSSQQNKKECYCIRCGERIPCNLENPYCIKCGSQCSVCNRFSASEQGENYCHYCGTPDYVTEEEPLCYECQQKHTQLKN